MDMSPQGLQRSLYQANLKIPVYSVFAFSFVLGAVFTLLASLVISPFLIPVYGLIGVLLPFYYLEMRIDRRAAKFAEDYPSVLFACASSIKSGLTPLAGLERAVELLPNESLCKTEVTRLVQSLSSGEGRDVALASFADSIRLPDLSLFRASFELVCEQRGRFAPTLERLARVARDRTLLISQARVSTASMNMTANVLIVIFIGLNLILTIQTKNFWNQMLEDPLINTIASGGLVVMTLGYIILKGMGRFKP